MTVTVDHVLTAPMPATDLRSAGSQSFWLRSFPEQGRRTSIHTAPEGQVVELTPAPLNVRSRVMEYGGGAWDVHEADGQVMVVAVDDDQRRVVRVAPDGSTTTPITPSSRQVHFGGLWLVPERGLVLAVREDHRGEGEAVSTIVALDLAGPNDDFGTVLVTGPDFVAGPRLSTDGRLAWFEWHHPAMPWDQAAVKVARLMGGPGNWHLSEVTAVADRADVSAQHPQWDGNQLYYSTDETGHWNIACWNGTTSHRITDSSHDHDGPVWTLERPAWAVHGGIVLCQRWVDGWAELVWCDGEREVVVDLPGLAEVESLTFDRFGAQAFCHFADAPARLVTMGPMSSQASLAQGPMPAGTGPRGRTEALWVEGTAGRVHAWLHLPLTDQRHLPLIVKSHGGPTAMAQASQSAVVDFWTSRGFAVVDVNYSGSTGFGRAYRNRLRGQWGVLDVADCAAVVDHLVASGIAHPERIAITGGSAGGYCTLQSLVTTRRYTAGVSRYGIGDLEMLATDTHKFEARYLDSLIGPYPEARATYRERSPIHHVDALATPMLILQGLDDQVVPPNQSQAMADAVAAKGLPVVLRTYPGEGHGFRGVDARRDALLSELAFYAKLWGLAVGDDLPELDW